MGSCAEGETLVDPSDAEGISGSLLLGIPREGFGFRDYLGV